MEYKIEIDTLGAKQWHDCASCFSDYSIYQSFCYQQIRADDERQSIKRVVVKGDGDVVLMGHVRIKQMPAIKLRIGYVQFGPLVGNGGLGGVGEAFRQFRIAMFKTGVNILRVVPNVRDDGFGKEFVEILNRAGFERVPGTKAYRTIIVSLKEDQEEIFRKIDKDPRRLIRKSQRQITEVKEGTSGCLFEILESIYLKSKIRKNFEGIDSSQFARTQEMLPKDQKSRILIAYVGDEPATALATSHFGNTAIPIMLANNELGLKNLCSYSLFWLAFLNAKKTGMEFYDMGGIDEIENPSGCLFKKKFGGDKFSYIGAFEASSSHVLSSGLHFLERGYKLIKRV